MKNIRILIVDDAYSMRSLLKSLLKKTYQLVGEAKDGFEAIEIYKKERPDIVLMDIVMPNLDGIEATKEIMRIDPYANIICITSSHDKSIKEQMMDIGTKAFLNKPFQPSYLYNRIDEVLKNSFQRNTEANKNAYSNQLNYTETVIEDDVEEDNFDFIEFKVVSCSDKENSIEINNSETQIKFPIDYGRKDDYLREDTLYKVEQEENIELIHETHINSIDDSFLSNRQVQQAITDDNIEDNSCSSLTDINKDMIRNRENNNEIPIVNDEDCRNIDIRPPKYLQRSNDNTSSDILNEPILNDLKNNIYNDKKANNLINLLKNILRK